MKEMNQTLYFNKQMFIKKSKGSINDNYTKIKSLGEGGFSTVYSIKSKKTNEIFACKEISKSRLKDIEKVKTEIEILIKTDHPNIVRLYEIYEDKLYIYLVIELCKGGELFNRILKKKVFTEIEAAYIFKQIMTAMNYCHNVLKICHRDLKPENIILISEDENNLNLKIADFGLGVIYNKSKNNNNLNFTQKVGSNYYIAPEVIKGNYNYKCDLWSAGVILFILLCGNMPFQGTTSKEIFKNIEEKNFQMNNPQWKNVSDEAKDLIKHLLCDENIRYSSQDVLNSKWFKVIENKKKFIYNLINNYTNLNINTTKPNINTNNEMFKPLNKKDGNIFSYYVGLNKFKKIVLTIIATKLSDDEIQDIKKKFNMFDLNMDGTVTLKEFFQVLSKFEPLKNDEKIKEAQNIFKGIDNDSSGRIDFTEFLAYAMEKKIYLDEKKLYQAFIQIDVNKSGKVTIDEFKKVLKIKGNYYDHKINLIYKKYDLNKDGAIDYEEFIYMMSIDEF